MITGFYKNVVVVARRGRHTMWKTLKVCAILSAESLVEPTYTAYLIKDNESL